MSTAVDFAAPPVTEVVAGIAFRSLGPQGVAAMSGFWRDRAQTQFPQFQVQPPYTPVMDAPQGNLVPPVSMQLLTNFPNPRFWAISDDGQHLLQLQPDWFACNWRRVRPNDDYDRWENRRSDFLHWYEALVAYVLEEDGPSLQPLTCEVTYINHITPIAGFETHADFDKVFVGLGPKLTPLVGRQISTTMHYEVPPTDGGLPLAALNVDITPGIDPKGDPVYVMNLTVRGMPKDGTTENVMAFLDLGRETINEAFVKLTTEEMQSAWGRKR